MARSKSSSVTAPVDATPVDATPVDATPVDATPVDATPVDATPIGDKAARVYMAAIMAGKWTDGKFVFFTYKLDKPRQANPPYPDRVLGELGKLTDADTDRLARLIIVPVSTVHVIVDKLSTRKGSSVEVWQAIYDGGAKIDRGLTFHDGQGNASYHNLDGSARPFDTVPDYTGSVEVWCERETVWRTDDGKIKSEKSK